MQTSVVVTGSDASLTCTANSITSPTNFNANLQWVGPDGSVLRQMDAVTSLVLELTPVTDFGDYVCVATLTSPMFPGITSTVSAVASVNGKL